MAHVHLKPQSPTCGLLEYTLSHTAVKLTHHQYFLLLFLQNISHGMYKFAYFFFSINMNTKNDIEISLKYTILNND